MKLIIAAVLIFSFHLKASENCGNLPPIAGSSVNQLSEHVLNAASQSFTKILNLSVNHAGRGDLSILLNPAGEIEAVKFYYKDGDNIKSYVVTSEELNQGKAIEYSSKDGGPSPLRLEAIRPPGLNPGKGGPFNLEIATSLNPLKKRLHTVKLSKENGKWVVDALGVRAKEVILDPGISWLSWDGTFQKVEFK
ncbi:MAG: hypothetical protein K2P81_11955 [Bacteriovoracaceae bacterium]|nr:hypothetical protein [Bacteriovoracaceae bacterium]